MVTVADKLGQCSLIFAGVTFALQIAAGMLSSWEGRQPRHVTEMRRVSAVTFVVTVVLALGAVMAQ